MFLPFGFIIILSWFFKVVFILKFVLIIFLGIYSVFASGVIYVLIVAIL